MRLRWPSLISVRACLADASLGLLVLPTLAIAGAPAYSTSSMEVIALLVGPAAFLAVHRLRLAGLRPAVTGLAMVGLMLWALTYASYSLAGPIAAAALGAGIGLNHSESLRKELVIWALPFTLLLVALRFLVSRDAAIAAGMIEMSAATLALLLCSIRSRQNAKTSVTPPPVAREQRRSSAVGRREFLEVGLGASALLSFAYLGATLPDAGWFGPMITHASGRGNLLSLTFDDGPSVGYTLKVKDILDSYKVKGTFFSVGMAVAARPDISRALIDGGHLVADHSYSHDYYRWLDPRYPELQKTQDAFFRLLGVRPAFYRPPHGTRSPFVARVVSDRKMKMIGWDVAAEDWSATDSKLVAHRILAGAQAGSIILLHDGLDGNLTADRSVLLAALPMILEGLKSRGFNPVGLDELLQTPAYLA